MENPFIVIQHQTYVLVSGNCSSVLAVLAVFSILAIIL